MAGKGARSEGASSRRPATILDVARVAGVAVGTVSRVLNKGPFVGPETSAVVREAVARLGYVQPEPGRRRGPKLGQRRRVAREQRRIDLILFGIQGLRWITDCAPVYSYVLHGIELATAERGLDFRIRQANDWAQIAALAHGPAEERPDGLLILGVEPADPVPPDLAHIPMAWVMGSTRRFTGDIIQPDHLKIGFLASETLLQAGHRHAAYMGRHTGVSVYHFGIRGDAFQASFQAAGGTVAMLMDTQLVQVSPDENSVNEACVVALLDRMMRLSPRPTALMLDADVLAPAVYRALADRGIRPQVDLTILTCNNERGYLASLRPEPLVVDVQAETIGRCALDRLLWRIDNPAAPAVRMLIPPVLVNRSVKTANV